MLSCTNPTLLKFIDCLKAEQYLTDLKITKRHNRERPENRAAKWIRYDEKLQKIVESYDDYSDKMEFRKAIGNCILITSYWILYDY